MLLLLRWKKPGMLFERINKFIDETIKGKFGIMPKLCMLRWIIRGTIFHMDWYGHITTHECIVDIIQTWFGNVRLHVDDAQSQPHQYQLSLVHHGMPWFNCIAILLINFAIILVSHTKKITWDHSEISFDRFSRFDILLETVKICFYFYFVGSTYNTVLREWGTIWYIW